MRKLTLILLIVVAATFLPACASLDPLADDIEAKRREIAAQAEIIINEVNGMRSALNVLAENYEGIAEELEKKDLPPETAEKLQEADKLARRLWKNWQRLDERLREVENYYRDTDREVQDVVEKLREAEQARSDVMATARNLSATLAGLVGSL